MYTPKTYSLLGVRLPNDLSNLVIKYFQAEDREYKSIVEAGEYETCLDIPSKIIFRKGFYYACDAGYKEIVEYFLSCGVNDYCGGFYRGCEGGHWEIILLFISLGVNDWNGGFYNACRGGHMELAEYMISLGANNWNGGLSAACFNNHDEIVKFIISKGADYLGNRLCYYCRQTIAEHPWQIAIAQ